MGFALIRVQASGTKPGAGGWKGRIGSEAADPGTKEKDRRRDAAAAARYEKPAGGGFPEAAEADFRRGDRNLRLLPLYLKVFLW